MPIDVLAWNRHYLDHLAPVWHALPDEARGAFYAPSHLRGHGKARGVAITPVDRRPDVRRAVRRGSGPVVVCAWGDARRVLGLGRPVVMAEHGAGFSFSNEHPSYAGGSGHHQLALRLVPNEHAAAIHRAAHPQVPVAVVGCPKLDAWHVRPAKRRDDPPVIALSFHWDCQVAPETRSAWPHYRDALPHLAANYRLLGHGHPWIIDELRPHYEACGVEVVTDFEEVLERADLYMCDSSSTLYEFASTGRPVVVLNAPWYRREVNHGLRFWDAADVGVNVDHPDELDAAIARALADPPEQQAAREAAVAMVYAYRDGTASQRAAAALLDLVIRYYGKPGMNGLLVYVNRMTGQRQYTVPGSFHHRILKDLPDWQPEAAPTPEPAPEPEPEPEPELPPLPTADDLPRMTKAELREVAVALGVEATFRTKADLVTALTAALAEMEASDGVRNAR